jgi:hypothetical protein
MMGSWYGCYETNKYTGIIKTSPGTKKPDPKVRL